MSFLAIDVGNTRLKWAHLRRCRTGAKLLAHGAEFLENIDQLPEATGRAWRGRADAGVQRRAPTRSRRVEEHLAELWDLAAQWVVPSASRPAVQRLRPSRPASGPTAGWR
jgi:type III pantothenate kinase